MHINQKGRKIKKKRNIKRPFGQREWRTRNGNESMEMKNKEWAGMISYGNENQGAIFGISHYELEWKKGNENDLYLA